MVVNDKTLIHMANEQVSIINANTLELHYWLNDGSHSMDAIIQNKCEYEFLGILKEVCSLFDTEIVIETGPLAEGGIVRWFKILSKKDKRSIVVGLIAGLVTAVIVTPISTSISKATEIIIEKIFEDKELKELEKESLKLDIELKRQKIEKSNVIAKKKSNFYEVLESYPKVKQFSILIENANKVSFSEERIINKGNFKEFILVNDDLEPTEINDAIIEIISPILKKGNYKWMGIYNGEKISFNMKSNEFKTLVQVGDIEFKNGSSINCFLKIRKRMDNEGVESIVGYDVIRVNQYFENENPIETPEGKKYRQQKEAEKLQMRFDFDLNE